MKWRKWLDKWDMTSLKMNPEFLDMEWDPAEGDKAAAWDLYIELLTRNPIQYLQPDEGHEKEALESIHEIFGLVRENIKSYEQPCTELTKISIVVLNQIVRPFTTKWYREILAGGFQYIHKQREFTDELAALQKKMRIFTQMLADMADVEDLTRIEEISDRN